MYTTKIEKPKAAESVRSVKLKRPLSPPLAANKRKLALQTDSVVVETQKETVTVPVPALKFTELLPVQSGPADMNAVTAASAAIGIRAKITISDKYSSRFILFLLRRDHQTRARSDNGYVGTG